MIKNGIINADLKYELTLMGHFDTLIICDMGFPVPKGIPVIDLSLVRGVPAVRIVLKAVLAELVVQSVVLMDKCEEANPQLFSVTKKIFSRQDMQYVSLSAFREAACDARFIIRTGDDAPCSNILLTSASGVISRVQQFNIPDDELALLG